METVKLLIMLDCLLDTRLSILASKDQQIAKTIVGSKTEFKKYAMRLTDDFSEHGLSRDEFLNLYRQRTVEVLVNSSATSLVFELNSIVNDILNNNELQPHKAHNLEVDINFWPYVLPDNVKENILVGISARVESNVRFNSVFIPNNVLSPSYLKYSDYGALYIYDFEQWFGHHFNPMVTDSDDLRNPQFTIYAPALWVDEDKLKFVTEFQSPDGSTCDPRDAMQFVMKQWFHLELLDPGVMSIVAPEYLISHEINK